MKTVTHVCHLTTVHPRNDARIFLKECTSLRNAGYIVTLIVADGLGESRQAGVRIVDVGQGPSHRLARMLISQCRAARSAFAQDAHIYHFHDPELIPLGILLRLCGHKVIYDAHEDLARSFENRHWIPLILRPMLKLIADVIEPTAALIFDGVIAATPTIAARFKRAWVVRNWPILAEFSEVAARGGPSPAPNFIYVGSISVERGALAMVQAINHPSLSGRARLVICGKIDEPGLRATLEQADRGRLVDYKGHVDRQRVAAALAASRAGLVVLQSSQAYMESLPVKLFEYLAAGLPVIASDFPLWRSLPGIDKLSLFVDPTSPTDIARAMHWILDNPTKSETMGAAGRNIAMEHYSWAKEQTNLLEIYTLIQSR